MSNIWSTAKSVSSYRKQRPFRPRLQCPAFRQLLIERGFLSDGSRPEKPGKCSLKNFTSTRKNELPEQPLWNTSTCADSKTNGPSFDNNYTSIWRWFFSSHADQFAERCTEIRIHIQLCWNKLSIVQLSIIQFWRCFCHLRRRISDSKETCKKPIHLFERCTQIWMNIQIINCSTLKISRHLRKGKTD